MPWPATSAPLPTNALLLIDTELSANAAPMLTLPSLLIAVASERASASALADALTFTDPLVACTIALLPIAAVLLADSTSTEMAAATPTPPPWLPDWPCAELFALVPLLSGVLVNGAPRDLVLALLVTCS